MTPELARLIEAARHRPPMTDAELREQCISFAYGNLHYENPAITRDGVRRVADELAIVRQYNREKALRREASR